MFGSERKVVAQNVAQ